MILRQDLRRGSIDRRPLKHFKNLAEKIEAPNRLMTRERREIRGENVIKKVKVVSEIDGVATVVEHDTGARSCRGRGRHGGNGMYW